MEKDSQRERNEYSWVLKLFHSMEVYVVVCEERGLSCNDVHHRDFIRKNRVKRKRKKEPFRSVCVC